MTFLNEISKAFNKKATEYEKAAKIQQVIGSRLLERLQYLKIAPQYILDLGCGPGHFSYELSMLYPKARIVGLDIALAMLTSSRNRQGWRRKWSLAAADMNQLPFATGSFDLIFANQVIHWTNSLQNTLRELNRVMNVNGCFMFTTLGPDTFKELKSCWQSADRHAHVNEFTDMHDVGDLLISEYFVDPVMDMELLTAHYESVTHLVRALKNQGVKNINPARNKGLTGKSSWNNFVDNYQLLRTANDKYPLTYEVVYGHAWKGGRQRTEHGVEAFIPINHIKRL